MLYRQLPFILAADIITATFLLAILFSIAYNPLSFIWFFILVGSTVLRGVFANNHLNHCTDADDYPMRRNFLIAGAAFSGILWGSVLLVLPPNPSLLSASLIGLWLAGLLAGAATTMSMMKQVFFSFAIPASLLFIAFLFLVASEHVVTLGGGFAMYVAFILPIAMSISADFRNAITLKLQNTNLRKKLEADTRRLEEKEAELLTQRRKQAMLQSQKAHIDEKLKAADQDRLLLLDAVQEGIYGTNNTGTITFINQSAVRLLGFEADEIIGRSAAQLIYPLDNGPTNTMQANSAISACYRHGVSVQSVESVFMTKTGRSIPVRFSCEPVKKQGDVIGAVVSFADISRQKEMEFMLIQSQKMEAIGRLTGGVSHDFNNLLTVIMGNLQFLQKQLTANEKVTTLLNKVMNAAKSGAELNNRLLSFSREQALETNPVDIGEMLTEIHEFLGRILGEEITLEVKNLDSECIAMTDRTQLENAILNLCVNAKDAMPNGGRLLISAKKVRHAESFIGHEISEKEKDYIELSITDNGIGIPLQMQKQIFEPFFTTKEKNQGTGLGLSTVYGFMRQSGGNITVSSREGEGATFKLYIPVGTEAVKAHRALPEPIANDDKYHGTILVVEDDDNVREVASQMLINAGFEVITANDGPSGLRLFQENPEVDLVFSDVIMPGGMTGVEMAEEILKLSPNKPILLTTGYTEKALKDRILEFSSIVCVAKPYDTNELPKYVNSMMRQGSL